MLQLATLIRCRIRLQEGYNFAQTNLGIVNLMLQVNMKVRTRIRSYSVSVSVDMDVCVVSRSCRKLAQDQRINYCGETYV